MSQVARATAVYLQCEQRWKNFEKKNVYWNQSAIGLTSWRSGLNTTIGHSACWANGLMAVFDLGSNPGLEGGFSAQLG